MTNTPLASHTLKWWNIFSFCYFYWILTHSSNKNYLFMDASTTWSKAPSILLSNNIFFIKLYFCCNNYQHRNSLTVQLLTMLAFTEVDPGTIPDQGTTIPQAAAKKKKRHGLYLYCFDQLYTNNIWKNKSEKSCANFYNLK